MSGMVHCALPTVMGLMASGHATSRELNSSVESQEQKLDQFGSTSTHIQDIVSVRALQVCDMHEGVAEGSCSSVPEHWQGKPKALGLIPSSSTFLSSPLPAILKVYGQ